MTVKDEIMKTTASRNHQFNTRSQHYESPLKTNRKVTAKYRQSFGIKNLPVIIGSPAIIDVESVQSPLTTELFEAATAAAAIFQTLLAVPPVPYQTGAAECCGG